MAELVGSSPKNYIVYIRSNYYNNKKPNVAPQLGSRESSLYVDRAETLGSINGQNESGSNSTKKLAQEGGLSKCIIRRQVTHPFSDV